MGYPNTSAKIPGYDPEQVDVLMERLQRQYQNPALKLVTSSILDAVKFDLVPGGYQIPAVDRDIASYAETFLEREVAGKLRLGGRDQISAELATVLREIRKVTELPAGKAFSRARNGYSRRRVIALLKKLDVKRGSISDLDAMELRLTSFGRARSGFDRAQVDDFLALVIRALHYQRALA